MYLEITHTDLRNSLDIMFKGIDTKPLLILGTSGIGKTYAVWDSAGQQGDSEKIKSFIQEALDADDIEKIVNARETIVNDLPYAVVDIRLGDIPKEDIAGFPQVNKTTGEVNYFLLDFLAPLFIRPANQEANWLRTQIMKAKQSFTGNRLVNEVIRLKGIHLGKVLIFFDELNRMEPGGIQSIMELVGQRTLHQRPLKDGVLIVGAMNPMDSNLYTTTNLSDIAFLRRWKRVLLTVSVRDWFNFMGDKLHPTIKNYLTENPKMLVREKEEKAPLNPEIWSEVNGVFNMLSSIQINDQTAELMTGSIIGDASIVEELFEMHYHDQPFYLTDPIYKRIADVISNKSNDVILQQILSPQWLEGISESIQKSDFNATDSTIFLALLSGYLNKDVQGKSGARAMDAVAHIYNKLQDNDFLQLIVHLKKLSTVGNMSSKDIHNIFINYSKIFSQVIDAGDAELAHTVDQIFNAIIEREFPLVDSKTQDEIDEMF